MTRYAIRLDVRGAKSTLYEGDDAESWINTINGATKAIRAMGGYWTIGTTQGRINGQTVTMDSTIIVED